MLGSTDRSFPSDSALLVDERNDGTEDGRRETRSEEGKLSEIVVAEKEGTVCGHVSCVHR